VAPPQTLNKIFKNPLTTNVNYLFFMFIFSLGTEPGDYSHLWNCAGSTKPSQSWMGGYFFTLTMTTCNFFSYRYATIHSGSRRLAFLCICSTWSSSVWLNLGYCISLSLKVSEVIDSDVKMQVDTVKNDQYIFIINWCTHTPPLSV